MTTTRVTIADIADRAGVTSTAVRYWISGDRGPGNFPDPVVDRPRSILYSWSSVSAWLAAAKVGQFDHVAAETARACTLVRDALAVRRGVRDLPSHDRRLITRFVAA